MGTQAGQFIPPARKTGTSQQSSKPALKPVIAGKPNPNIGMGLRTPSDQPQFGEVGWVNPNYDLYHNADGYHRFDPKVPGMGLQMSRTYADGGRVFDVYQNIAKGKPGYTHAQNALNFLNENGINPGRATDLQKFAAMDHAMRLVQWKNQRPTRKFGIKDAFGLALSVGAIFAGNPYVAAGLAGTGSAVQGGDIGDILTASALAGIGNYVGGTLGSEKIAGNSVDAMVAASAGAKAASTASQLGKVASGAANVAKTVAPYVGSAIVAGNAINQSGANLSPDQYSIRQGGNPKITTFEPENQNIAYSQYPTSAYLGAYPGAPESTATTASPITPTPAAPIAGTANAARPYVAPPRIPIAPNIPIVNYDPSRNYAPLTQQLSPRAPTMQQALMRPAATRRQAQNATTA